MNDCVSWSLSPWQQDTFVDWPEAARPGAAHCTFVIIVCRRAHQNSSYSCCAGFLLWQGNAAWANTPCFTIGCEQVCRKQDVHDLISKNRSKGLRNLVSVVVDQSINHQSVIPTCCFAENMGRLCNINWIILKSSPSISIVHFKISFWSVFKKKKRVKTFWIFLLKLQYLSGRKLNNLQERTKEGFHCVITSQHFFKLLFQHFQTEQEIY